MIAVLTLAAAASVTAFDCTVEMPRNLARTGDKAELRPINIGSSEASNRFRLSIEQGRSNLSAQIDWPGDPWRIAGKFPALESGKGAYVFTAFNAGPCLFTETACMTLVNVVTHDHSAKLIIQPAALATDSAADTREPFVVVAEGSCTIAGEKK